MFPDLAALAGMLGPGVLLEAEAPKKSYPWDFLRLLRTREIDRLSINVPRREQESFSSVPP
jgi:hypothetical protein